MTDETEFGHVGFISQNVCIDSWGVGPFLIVAEDGKSYRFEDSDRFGPALVKKNGDPLANPWPNSRSPFWRAHRIWKKQGRRCEDDGVTCIWEEPKPQVIQMVGKRTALVIEHGEPDGKTVTLRNLADRDQER